MAGGAVRRPRADRAVFISGNFNRETHKIHKKKPEPSASELFVWFVYFVVHRLDFTQSCARLLP
jgi:hypothetical protein